MCGFICFINDNNLSNKYLNYTYKDELSNHRGPNSQKFYRDNNFFAYFRRLSIIDVTQKSNQPIISENKRYVLIFNGEIYNFRELRTRLKKKNITFKSNGDAEVILKSFIYYGEGFIEELRGMFSFCIWDKHQQRLTAYRDRFGQKPLYYHRTNRGLIISSEIKDIKKVVDLSKDSSTINKYLFRNILDTNNQTFYNNLKRLEPSRKLIFEKNTLKISKYYDLKFSEKKHFDPEEFLDIYNSNLKLHLQSDVKIAFLLSGGIDSSSVVASSLNFKKDIKAFTVIPKHTFNEKPYINHFEKKKKISHEYINLDDKINVDSFKNALSYQDEPFHGTNSLYQFLLNQEIIKRKYKVVITGEGADEVLGGYDRMFLYYMWQLLDDNKIKKFNDIAYERNLNKNLLKKNILTLKKNINNNATDFENNKAFEYLNSNSNKDKYYNLKWNDLRTSDKNFFKKSLKNSIYTNDLQIALRMSDRNSMSSSIENRTPYLDHKFVDYIFSIKSEDFYYNNMSKGMLRFAMKETCPKKILNRTNKTGRPGSDMYFIFKKVFDDYIDLLDTSDLNNYGFDVEKIKKTLLKYKKSLNYSSNLNKNFRNDMNFFFRIYSYLVWSKLG